jgi:hypothetical protein
MQKKRIDPGFWRFDDRPRALIEDADLGSALATASALRRAGYAVAICRGPEPDEYCPLVGAYDCALVAGADVVVSSLGEEIEEAVQRRHPSTPLVTSVDPETVVAAVGRAIGDSE